MFHKQLVVAVILLLAGMQNSHAFADQVRVEAQSAAPEGSPAQMLQSSAWKFKRGQWMAAPGGRSISGENGILIGSAPAPDNFSVTVKMRFDSLRFLARPPFSGIAFHVVDEDNWDALVLSGTEAQLVWRRMRNGKETVLAQSESGLYIDVGEPFWMRLTLQDGILEAHLSLDSIHWVTLLHASCPGVSQPTYLGWVAGIPATWFSWGLDASASFPEQVAEPYVSTFEDPNPASNMPGRADYLRILRQYSSEPVNKMDDPGLAAWASLEAWKVSKDVFYRDRFLSYAKSVLSGYRRTGNIPVGFAVFYPQMAAIQEAMQEGLLTPAEREEVPAFAAQAMLRGEYERGAMNRALGNLVGIAPALSLNPAFPKRAQVEEIAKSVESDFAKYGYAPIEDSTNYVMLSLVFASQHALNSRPEWWQQPGFRGAFENVAREVSPGGHLPGFGDDDEGQQGKLLGLMELASSKWQEPLFRDVVRRVWAASFGAKNPPHKLKAIDLLGLSFAARYTPETALAALPVKGVDILYRANGAPVKAVVRNGGTWAMLDLFSGGEHGHNDALSFVSIESNGHVLMEDNGRYARGMAFHSRPEFTIHAEDFPLPKELTEQTRRERQRYMTLGEWTLYRLPLHDHWVWGNFAGDLGLPTLDRAQYHPDIPASFNYDPKTQSVLLTEFRGFGDATISIADPRITGPAGSRKIALTIPQGASVVKAHMDPMGFRGSPAYIWHVPLKVETQYLGGLFDGKTALAAGTANEWLEFWLKVDAPPAVHPSLVSIVMGDSDGYPKRWIDALSPNGPVRVVPAKTPASMPRLVVEQDMISQQGTPLRFIRDVLMPLPELIWVRDTIKNDGDLAGSGGVVWYGTHPVGDETNQYRFGSGLGIRIDGAQTSGIDDKKSYGMRDSSIVFGRDDVPAHASKTVDTLLTPVPGSWKKVLETDGAVVWSNGTYWAGRNPQKKRLRFKGFTTSDEAFVLSKSK